MADAPKLPTTFPPPPAYPASSVDPTDPAWVDYHARLNQYVGKLAAYAAQVAIVAAAAEPATTDSTGN